MIKGALKPNWLTDFKYFQIIFEVLGIFSSLSKLMSPKKKWETFQKKFGFWRKNFGSGDDTEFGPWFQFPISKPGFGHTLTATELRLLI